MHDEYARGYQAGYRDALNLKEGFKCSIFGMEVGQILNILAEHVRKQKSETPDIPMGFKFNWHNRKEINNVFSELCKQGFKIYKAKE